MGGQVASPGSIHLDMRKLSRVLKLLPVEKVIRVEAGIRWCDIQRIVDAHDLSVKIMQTYANFTVGGSLSVNCHGRYVGLGPLILSVRSISIVMADGERLEASPTHNRDIFFAAIGGYGAIGVIVEAELELADNTRLERHTQTLGTADYLEHFRQKVRASPQAVFHNADLYPPHYTQLRTVTWAKTTRYVTNPRRVMRVEPSHIAFRYLFWSVSEFPFGKWRRRYIYEPLFYLGENPVHWRNYEAGYDVAELEPESRRRKTYVLQEYFVPIDRFDEFAAALGEVFRRFDVNIVNVSIRHAIADSGSLMAWARGEVFAFVVYYKQHTDGAARNEVAVWTRAAIDAVLGCGGTYYLPYQIHATREQFHRAYPGATELFARKAKLDPEFRFRNGLWDSYYPPTRGESAAEPEEAVETSKPVGMFHTVFDDVGRRDRFFLFLQNVYNIVPEAAFHWLIRQACEAFEDDESIYRYIQEGLGAITPALAPLRFGLPALRKQKREMVRQILVLLEGRARIDGYLEIGSTGRYISELKKVVTVTGSVHLINDVAPSYSVIDMFERGQVGKLGTFHPLHGYAPITGHQIADESLDVVTCLIGLHHVPRESLDGFVKSIARVLRPGGVFILRDHDAGSEEMKTFVALVHTVFNAGLMAPWSTDCAELRHFTGADEIAEYVVARGFRDLGRRLFQDHDPSDNAMMAFIKEA